MTPRVRVIACGNDAAGDDAAGLLAVRAAAPRLAALPAVVVVEARTALNAVHLFADVGAAIVVDAVRTAGAGTSAGKLVRLEVHDGRLPGGVGSSLSTHGFGLGEALGVAAALGDLPTVVVLGIEAADVVHGASPSPPVLDAIDALADLIVTEAERLCTP